MDWGPFGVWILAAQLSGSALTDALWKRLW